MMFYLTQYVRILFQYVISIKIRTNYFTLLGSFVLSLWNLVYFALTAHHHIVKDKPHFKCLTNSNKLNLETMEDVTKGKIGNIS